MKRHQQLVHDLMQLNQKLHRMYHIQLPQQMSRMDFFILKLLQEAQEAGRDYTVSDLARKMEVTPPAISRKLRELSSANYVERYQRPEDRRNTYLSIAPMGQAVLQQANRRSYQFTQCALERVSDQEVAEYIRIGHALIEAMEDIIAEEQKGETHGETI